MSLSFKQFLGMLEEDLQQDINKLATDLAMVDTQINQRTQPLLQRKAQIQKILAQKQQQKAVEDKRNPQQGDDQQAMQADQQAQLKQAPAPGASSAQTPGSRAPTQ